MVYSSTINLDANANIIILEQLLEKILVSVACEISLLTIKLTAQKGKRGGGKEK